MKSKISATNSEELSSSEELSAASGSMPTATEKSLGMILKIKKLNHKSIESDYLDIKQQISV